MYIYRISNGHETYIGQSLAEGSSKGEYNRLIEHLRIAYGLVKQSDPEELKKMICHNNLQNLQIEVYEESQNYGLPEDCFLKFFQIFAPYGKRNVMDKVNPGQTLEMNLQQTVTREMKLDAAEILHIINAINEGEKLFNTEMGGAYTAWTFLNDTKTGILSKKFSPQQSFQVFNTIDAQLNSLQIKLDQAFQKGLNSIDGTVLNEQIQNNKKDLNLGGQQFLYNNIKNGFGDKKKKTGAYRDFLDFLKKENPKLAFNNLSLDFLKPSQIGENLATVFAKSGKFQIKRQKLSIDDLQNLFSAHQFTSGKDFTLAYHQVFKITGASPYAQGGKAKPTPTYTQENVGLQNQIKKVSADLMHKAFISVTKDQKNTQYETLAYAAREIDRVSDTEALKWASSIYNHQSLSSRIHEYYRKKNITAPLVTQNGISYYRGMLTYVMSSEYKNNKGETLDHFTIYDIDENNSVMVQLVYKKRNAIKVHERDDKGKRKHNVVTEVVYPAYNINNIEPEKLADYTTLAGIKVY